MALRFAGPLGSSPDSIRGSQGTPHLGTWESVLGRMRWLLRHSGRVLEGLANNNNSNCRISPEIVAVVFVFLVYFFLENGSMDFAVTFGMKY